MNKKWSQKNRLALAYKSKLTIFKKIIDFVNY